MIQISDMFSYIILPLLIFSARVADVSLGTLRIVFISKGIIYLAPLVAFFEILLWMVAMGVILNHLTNPIYYIAFAGGFATGTFVGILLEKKLSLGKVMIRVITRKEADILVSVLKAQGYGITHMDAKGSRGCVKIMYTVIDRHDVAEVLSIIKRYNPKAFYTVEDVKTVSENIPAHTSNRFIHLPTIVRQHHRKSV